MKIVMLCDFYNEKLEYQENLLVKYYTKHGHDVVVICSTFDCVFDYYSDNHNRDWPARTYFDGKAKIIKLKYCFNILNRLRRYTSIKGILETEKPDLIYVHDVMLNMLEAAAYIKRNPATKMIMDCHTDYYNSGKNWLSLKVLHGVCRKWFLDRARKHITKIFPIVPGSVDFLHEVYKVPKEMMEILPLGGDIDQGVIARQSPNLTNLKQKYDIKADTQVIFSGGKLEPRKMTEHLIDAVNQMGRDNLRLIVIGTASERDQSYYQMLLDKANHNPHIHFAGWQDKTGVYEHLALADIAAFPASQSILWQQAISMALPLLVGNSGNQSVDYLNLHDNIVVWQRQDINADTIQQSLERVLDNEVLAKRMSDGARKVTASCLDWNNLINRTLRYNTAQESAQHSAQQTG